MYVHVKQQQNHTYAYFIKVKNGLTKSLYYRRPSDIDSPMVMTPTATSPSTPNTASIFNFPKT